MNSFNLIPPDLSPDLQLRQVKASIIRQDLPNILRQEQRDGFPRKYTLLLRQRGRETRRKLSTLQPRFFNIGTLARPTEINFVAGEGMQEVVEAVEFASLLFRRRAPVRSGDYVSSARMWVNGVERRPSRVNPETLREGTRILFGPTTLYASTIEAGHHTGFYRNALRGGIVRYVTEAVRNRYGASVAVRMVYQPRNNMMIPLIEFGPAGAFPFSLGGTGANARRRARERRRRS